MRSWSLIPGLISTSDTRDASVDNMRSRIEFVELNLVMSVICCTKKFSKTKFNKDVDSSDLTSFTIFGPINVWYIKITSQYVSIILQSFA